MLDNARSDAAQRFLTKHPILIEVLHLDAHRPLDRLADTGNGQAPLLHDVTLVGFVEEDGIDHDPFEILAPGVAVLAFPERGAIDDEQANGLADLGRGQPDALRLVHGLPHVRNELGEPLHVLIHIVRLLPEHGIAIGDYRQYHGANLRLARHSACYLCTMAEHSRALDTIEDAIEDIRQGKVIIVVDDEDRENEGDFVAAARFATPEMINFMAVEGRGLICAPLIEDRCDELELELMVNRNNAAFETPFTVSVDLVGKGCTTGISAQDRAKTIQALIDPTTRPEELGRPGHIFPLRARRGGVLRRAGHTEAAIDLARLAGLEAAGVIVEIMNPDGTMARLPELLDIADRFGLRIVSIEDLIAYRLANDTLIERSGTRELDTAYGRFTMTTYRQTTGDGEHFALTRGEWSENDPIPVRVHAGQPRFDLLHAPAFGRGEALHLALSKLGKMDRCAFVYLESGDHPWSAIHDLPEGPTAVDPSTHGVGEAELKRRHGRTAGSAPRSP